MLAHIVREYVCLCAKLLSQTDVPLWDCFVRSVLEQVSSSNKVVFRSFFSFNGILSHGTVLRASLHWFSQ